MLLEGPPEFGLGEIWRNWYMCLGPFCFKQIDKAFPRSLNAISRICYYKFRLSVITCGHWGVEAMCRCPAAWHSISPLGFSVWFILVLVDFCWLSKAWKAGHPDYQIRLDLGGKELYTTEILAVAGGRLDKNSVLNSSVFAGFLCNEIHTHTHTFCWHSPICSVYIHLP